MAALNGVEPTRGSRQTGRPRETAPTANVNSMRLPSRGDGKSGIARETSPGAALDRELAARLGEGDKEALARLLDRHLGPVCGYLRRRLGPGHEELISAVAAQTFRYALRHMKSYARGTAAVPMRLWLFRIAGKELARKQKKTQAEPAEANPESDRLRRLRHAMSDLHPRKQAALSFALFEQLPAEEVAAATGISTARAMRLLRSALRDASGAVQVEEAPGG